jgi:hypothetical protein
MEIDNHSQLLEKVITEQDLSHLQMFSGGSE